MEKPSTENSKKPPMHVRIAKTVRDDIKKSIDARRFKTKKSLYGIKKEAGDNKYRIAVVAVASIAALAVLRSTSLRQATLRSANGFFTNIGKFFSHDLPPHTLGGTLADSFVFLGTIAATAGAFCYVSRLRRLSRPLLQMGAAALAVHYAQGYIQQPLDDAVMASVINKANANIQAVTDRAKGNIKTTPKGKKTIAFHSALKGFDYKGTAKLQIATRAFDAEGTVGTCVRVTGFDGTTKNLKTNESRPVHLHGRVWNERCFRSEEGVLRPSSQMFFSSRGPKIG